MKRQLLTALCNLLCLLGTTVSIACGVRLHSPEPVRSASYSAENDPAAAQVLKLMARDIDVYVEHLTDDDRFSGVVFVVFDGAMVIVKGYGWASSKEALPNQPTTMFRISSLSKAFTAAAVLLLQEQGRLRVDDPICAYLASCPPSWHAVTIHQLLTHTSGIPDYVKSSGFWKNTARQPVSAGELIALVADQPLVAEPGMQFAYSNSGYVLLGYLVGQMAGPSPSVEMAFLQFLEEHIFAPLHMEATGNEQCQTPAPVLAAGYVTSAIPAAPCDPSAFFAMGDLYSNVYDLYRWGQALEDDRLLAAPLRAMMVYPYAATLEFQTSYGYGWYITELGGVRRIWHAGATPGYRSFFQREAGRETMIIILSNYEVAPVIAMGREIAAVLIRRDKDCLR